MVACEHKNRKSICRVCAPKGHIRHVLYERMFQVLGSPVETEKFLGCSFQEFLDHLEKKFRKDPGRPMMTWKNYSTVWEIDHKTPVKFTFPKGKDRRAVLKERLRFTNTHPEYININRSKSNRFMSGGAFHPLWHDRGRFHVEGNGRTGGDAGFHSFTINDHRDLSGGGIGFTRENLFGGGIPTDVIENFVDPTHGMRTLGKDMHMPFFGGGLNGIWTNPHPDRLSPVLGEPAWMKNLEPTINTISTPSGGGFFTPESQDTARGQLRSIGHFFTGGSLEDVIPRHKLFPFFAGTNMTGGHLKDQLLAMPHLGIPMGS